MVSSDVAPFRPEQHDQACRVRTRRHPVVPAANSSTLIPTAGSVAAPSRASSSRPAAALGAEAAGSTRSPFAVEQQQQQQLLPPGSQLVAGGHWTEGGHEFEPPLALTGPLPPAGLRATLARRLVTPVAKKRRVGDRSRMGGSDGGDGSVGKQAGQGIRLFGRSGVDTVPAGVVGENDNDNDDGNGNEGLAGATVAPGRNEEEASDLPPLEAASSASSSNPHSGKATASAVAATGGGGWDPRELLAEKSSNGVGTVLPPITSGTGCRHPDEGAGDSTIRRRGAVVRGGGPWVGIMNFADINDDDENVSPTASHVDCGTPGSHANSGTPGPNVSG